MDIKEPLTGLLNRLFGDKAFPLNDQDRVVLLREFKRRLLPVSMSLFFVYFTLSILHPFVIKDSRTAFWLTIVGIASTLFFGCLAFASTRIKGKPDRTFVIGFCIALILCGNSGLHLYLTREAIQSTNFMLVILGFAFVVTVWSHYVSFLMLAWSIWIVSGPMAFEDPHWHHFLIMLAMGTTLSILTFHMSTHKLVTDARTKHTLAQAKELAESANLAKSSFLSRVSHELRTPLNSIIGFSSILETEDMHSEHRSQIQLIRKSGEHLLKLINEVLDLSKIDLGEIDLSNERVLVVPLMDEIADMIRPIANQRKISIRMKYHCPNGQEVLGDQQRMRQIFLNLASNGIKYNQEGGSLEMSVSEVEDQSLHIRFTDNGIGIPASKMHRLFVPFDRLDIEQSTLNIEGTGLGLALCEKFVMEMGGAITASSGEGKGSTFTVTLRACPDSAELA